MSRYTFRLPDIGEGIAEAEIVAWHVKVGDPVEEDGRLADMMTDKATVEMESPVAGRVVELAGEIGDMVPIGAPLAVIETDGGIGDEPAPPEDLQSVEPPQPASQPTPEDVAPDEERNADEIARQQPEHTPEASSRAQRKFQGEAPRASGTAKVLASPAVRARARDLGIDLGAIRLAGDGRIRHADLDAFVAYGAAQGFAAAGQAGEDQQVRVTGLRRRIAENMAASKRHIPHFSYVEECDVTDLEAVRGQLNRSRSAAAGENPPSRLTLLPFLITAICRTVPEFPMINARFDDEAGVITRHGRVHLGIATQTNAGLMVPVIRNAQGLNLWQLAHEIARLADAARDGSATAQELSGSTLTVTSLGPLGGIASTPVINRPEVAIVAPNRIVERPAFVADGLGGERLEKRKLMNLSISCDHRVVDGSDAARFVQALKRLLETPALLLIAPGSQAAADGG